MPCEDYHTLGTVFKKSKVSLWKTVEWKCVRRQTLYASQLNITSFMKNCTWKNFVCHVYNVYWFLTRNTHEKTLKAVFVCVSTQSTRLFATIHDCGSITIHLYVDSSLSNGQRMMKVHWRGQRPFHCLVRLWPLFSGDSQGIILIDYLEKGKTLTGDYYAPLLGHFKKRSYRK